MPIRSVVCQSFCFLVLVVAVFGSETAFADSPTLQLTETAGHISVSFGEQLLVAYNKKSPPVPDGIKPIYYRSGFLHPVNTRNGKTLTATFPADHPHQHGIFTAWTKTTYDGEPIDFWNLAKGQGRVLHESVMKLPATPTAKRKPSTSVSFRVSLLHRIMKEPPVDVLRETWLVTVAEPSNGQYTIDLKLKQEALTTLPLVCEKYHYGGVAVRGTSQWLLPTDVDVRSKEPVTEPGYFLNSAGSDRLKGNHQPVRWVAMAGQIDGEPAWLAALGHAKNPRSPQPARLHPTKPYFCFAPCVNEAFVIDQKHPYTAEFRFVVADGKPDFDALDQVWEKWCNDRNQATP